MSATASFQQLFPIDPLSSLSANDDFRQLSPITDFFRLSAITDIRYCRRTPASGHHMLVRTFIDLGAVMRDRRRQLKLNQAALARKIGVSRQWVIDVEKGHERAELGLVLRAIDALNIRLDARTDHSDHVKRRGARPVDIDAIISRARKAFREQ